MTTARGVEPIKGPAEGGGCAALALRVRGKNISETTLLATDYLNHFNEITMLLALVPEMPECLDDARAWVPKSYEEHFRDSGFVERDLAILAYRQAPARFRVPFDATVAQMDRLVPRALDRIERAIASGDRERVAETVASASRGLQRLIDTASAIIHGEERTLDQAEIDAMLAG